jgi:hypothetical protein
MERPITAAGVIATCLLPLVGATHAFAFTCSEMPNNGRSLSGPAAVSVKQGGFSSVDVFVRGIDNRILESRLSAGSGWTPWAEVPGDGRTISKPAAVFHNGVERLFIRGSGNGILENDFDGTNWTGWQMLPGNGQTLSGPFAIVHNDGVKLLVRGVDNFVYINERNATTWNGWKGIAGALSISEPAAAVIGGQLNVFIRDANNRVSQTSLGAVWSPWAEVAGNGLISSGPSAVTVTNPPNSMTELVAAGLDDGLWENTRPVNSQWSPTWMPITGPGVTPHTPSAIYKQLVSLAIYYTGEDGRIYECQQVAPPRE